MTICYTADTLDTKVGVEQNAAVVDSREQTVITGSHFFEPYKEELHELVGVLYGDNSDGLQWSDDPRDMLAYIRARWIGIEHGNDAAKDQFTPEQYAAAMPLFARLGLAAEMLPPAGTHFDDVIVLGGTTQANYRREAIAHKSIGELGITTERITLWFGQRLRFDRDGTKQDILSTLGRFAGNFIAKNPWVRRQLQTKRWEIGEGDDPWEALFADETALGRAAMLKQIPGGETAAPHRIDLQVTDVTGAEDPTALVPTPAEGAPAQLITDYRFDVDGQEIIIVNAAAVARKQGSPRHTTDSCTVEWLERHAPPENARVLFVTSNPHTLRTAQDMQLRLRECGRSDIELFVAGAGPPENPPIQLFLGEIGRLIDNDVSRNYAPLTPPEPQEARQLGQTALR